MSNTIRWQMSAQAIDVSTLYIYPMDTKWAAFPAIYIMAKQLENGFWRPLYIGQTGDMGARLAQHEHYHEAVRLGANHLHVRNMAGYTEDARCAIEKKAIEYWKPELNTVYKQDLLAELLKSLGKF